MHFGEIIKILYLILGIVFLLFFYHRLLKNFVKSTKQKLWFASGALLFFTLLLLFAPLSFFATEDGLNLSTIKIILQCFWWLSLYSLLNQLLDHWLWNRFFLGKGIVVSRILRDFVSVMVLITIIAATIHFVFLRSVWGIFTASGVVAIILGYSAQATLSDIFAGLGLNTCKQFSEGDWIKINDGSNRLPGMVTDINWRFVNLMTLDNNYLSIPNSVISKLQVINLSQPLPLHGVTLPITLQTHIPPEQFKKILLSAAHQCGTVLAEPQPRAMLTEIKGHEYLYQLAYYTQEMNELPVNDEILSIVWYQCRRNQVTMIAQDMIPGAELPSPEMLNAFLLKTDLFSLLGNGDMADVAANSICHHYGPPEMILEKGQQNTSLFIIYSGSIEVYISKKIQPEYLVATLGQGQYFGEMSMLTGELCSASMIVRSESMIIEITHDTMKTLFSKQPQLMEEMAKVVVKRKMLNANVKASTVEKKAEVHHTIIERLLSRVRDFFTHHK